jgi:hypothetical protein
MRKNKRTLKVESLEVRNCLSILGATYDALTQTISVQRSAGDNTTEFRVALYDGTIQTIKSTTVDGSAVKLALQDPTGNQFRIETRAAAGDDLFSGGTGGTKFYLPQGKMGRTWEVVNGFTLAGDFNNDGLTDFVGVSSVNQKILCTLGTDYGSKGSFESAKGEPLAVGDFDGDGKLDVVGRVTGSNGQQLNLYRGNGDGTFKTPVTLMDKYEIAYAVIAGDFNKDGKLDLIVQGDSIFNTDVINAYYLQGNGNGTFAAPVVVATQIGDNFYTASGDFNNDGNLDFIVTTNASHKVMLGNGNGTFRDGVQVPRESSRGAHFCTGDFNNDGITEWAFAGGNSSDNNLRIVAGDGSVTTVQTPLKAYSIVAGDFNGDSVKDFAISGTNTIGRQSTVILYGASDGTYTSQVVSSTTAILCAGKFVTWQTEVITNAVPVPVPVPTPPITPKPTPVPTPTPVLTPVLRPTAPSILKPITTPIVKLVALPATKATPNLASKPAPKAVVIPTLFVVSKPTPKPVSKPVVKFWFE